MEDPIHTRKENTTAFIITNELRSFTLMPTKSLSGKNAIAARSDATAIVIEKGPVGLQPKPYRLFIRKISVTFKENATVALVEKEPRGFPPGRLSLSYGRFRLRLKKTQLKSSSERD